MDIRIVFAGAGRMASAIVHGLLEKGHYRPDEVACTCGDDPTGPALAEKTGIHYLADPAPVLAGAETLLLACKPQQFDALNPDLVEAASGKLVLSILAGTPLKRLAGKFPEARNIVRTMPNTPGQIGAGITAFAPLKRFEGGERQRVEDILSALGRHLELPEEQLDAVTALSGSGPAYVFEFCAALREAGIKAGLEPGTAGLLAGETVLGAAKLLAASGETPEALRDAVTSPGGTTAAALEVFAGADLRGLVERAVAAARDRSVELAG